MRSRLERIAIDLLDRNLPRFAALLFRRHGCMHRGGQCNWIRGQSKMQAPSKCARFVVSGVSFFRFLYAGSCRMSDEKKRVMETLDLTVGPETNLRVRKLAAIFLSRSSGIRSGCELRIRPP